MIAIVRMLPNALGFRPTASAALPPTMPTPTPAPSPAKAKGKNWSEIPGFSSQHRKSFQHDYFLSFFSCFSFLPPTRSMVSTGKFSVRSLSLLMLS